MLLKCFHQTRPLVNSPTLLPIASLEASISLQELFDLGRQAEKDELHHQEAAEESHGHKGCRKIQAMTFYFLMANSHI